MHNLFLTSLVRASQTGTQAVRAFQRKVRVTGAAPELQWRRGGSIFFFMLGVASERLPPICTAPTDSNESKASHVGKYRKVNAKEKKFKILSFLTLKKQKQNNNKK